MNNAKDNGNTKDNDVLNENSMESDNVSVSEENAEFKEKYLRLLAEFTNYQRQKEAELKSMAQFGNSNLIIKFLDIIDDIDMGLIQENLAEDTKNILEILSSKMQHLLSLEGVKEIEVNIGGEYNSNTCEVITTQEDEKNKGKIVQIIRKGYTISDRVLRTAKVIVGK
jgi:molecular chaperone GrpE